MDPYSEIRALITKHHHFRITFLKAGGAKRVIEVDTEAGLDFITGNGASMQAVRQARNPHLVNLYSLDNQGFRAVNLETVQEVASLDGDNAVYDVTPERHVIRRSPL